MLYQLSYTPRPRREIAAGVGGRKDIARSWRGPDPLRSARKAIVAVAAVPPDRRGELRVGARGPVNEVIAEAKSANDRSRPLLSRRLDGACHGFHQFGQSHRIDSAHCGFNPNLCLVNYGKRDYIRINENIICPIRIDPKRTYNPEGNCIIKTTGCSCQLRITLLSYCFTWVF